MDRIGSAEYLEACADLIMLGLAYLAVQWVSRPHYHRVSHRKLRALAARRVLVAGNQAHSSRTVLCTPATGPNLQAGLSRLDGSPAPVDLAVLGAEQPAPGLSTVTAGAGAEPQAVTTADDLELSRRRPLPGGGLGPKHRATTAALLIREQGPETRRGGSAQQPAGVADPRHAAPTGIHSQLQNLDDHGVGLENAAVPGPEAAAAAGSVA